MTVLKSFLLPFLLLATAVAPGWLGVFLGETEDGKAMVTEVVAGSPAEKAGIRAGDAILAINGKEIGGVEEVVSTVGGLEAGTKVKVALRREGATKVVEVTLGTRPADLETGGEAEEAARRAAEKARAEAEKARAEAQRAAEKAKAERAKAERAKAEKAKAEKAKTEGDKQREEVVEVRERPKASGRPYLGVALEATDHGVVVGEVLDGSPAGKAGVPAGCTLLAIGDRAIKTLDDVDAAMGKLKAGDKIALKVRKGDAEPRSIDVVLGAAGGGSREIAAAPKVETKPAPKVEKKPAVDVARASDRPATRAADATLRTDVGAALREARGRAPVVLVFGADWDSGTKALRRSLADEGVRKALEGAVVVWVDTDRNGRVADEYDVQQIPHMIALDMQGKKIGALEGYQPPDVIIAKAKELRAQVRGAATAKTEAPPKPETRAVEAPQRVRVVAPPAAVASPKPAKAGEGDLQAEVRALRDEIRELREVLRELLKEQQKRR